MEALIKAVTKFLTDVTVFFAGMRYQKLQTKLKELQDGLQKREEAQKAADDVDGISIDDIIDQLRKRGRVRDSL